ncbi:hypothetical protein CHH28_19625 [Bacterioplanes sanyensis]|uniref:Chromosome partitioning protein ParA n=1 Tax=Bacterioplanes sanyensis TaxID=1249553 RepID=A0A222FR96_9GAMM|nr:DUF4404 family protein [Bacterioplanes sanyensis]ASP40743.1 hypothetical protein CHH28_19625 [Bacterioplanes sanyensis]
MPNDSLKQQLEQLHETLQQQPELNDSDRQLVKQIAQDIEQMGVADDDLSERIRQQAVQFEQQHPAIAEALRQVMDTLARIGV